jgi:hypothetical protein
MPTLRAERVGCGETTLATMTLGSSRHDVIYALRKQLSHRDLPTWDGLTTIEQIMFG